MKLDVGAIVSDLKGISLPVAEDLVIKIVDSVLGSIKKQALAQPDDAVADVVALLIGSAQPAIDAELAKLLPAAPKA